MRTPQAGKYGYDGSCKPTKERPRMSGQVSFSLGIFRWVEMKTGKGLKREKVFTRVTGPVSQAELVYATAERICDMLDNGTVHPAELKKTIQYDSDCYVTKDAKK